MFRCIQAYYWTAPRRSCYQNPGVGNWERRRLLAGGQLLEPRLGRSRYRSHFIQSLVQTECNFMDFSKTEVSFIGVERLNMRFPWIGILKFNPQQCSIFLKISGEKFVFLSWKWVVIGNMEIVTFIVSEVILSHVCACD